MPRRRHALATMLILLLVPAAAAAARVGSAHGATRAALVRAVVHQDGTSAGVTGVYVSGANGVVCQRTPDGGLVRYLFHHSGAWRFAFSTRGSRAGSATQRRLEAACH